MKELLTQKDQLKKLDKIKLNEDKNKFIQNGLLRGYSELKLRNLYKERYGSDDFNSRLPEAYRKLKTDNCLNSLQEAACQVYLARYNDLYSQAIEQEDYKLAADILAKSQKILGLESQKVDAKVDTTIEVV